MRGDGRRGPGEIDIVRIRIARKALDIVCVSKRVLFFGRSMTPHAIESESCVGICERWIVIVNTLSIPNLGPVPTVLRSLTVLNHDGPTIYRFWRLELVPRRWCRILFLNDHRSIWNHPGWVLSQEPIDDSRRV